MVWQLRKCVNCEKYTLNKTSCPYCGGPVRIPHPPKFSPDDKYLKYRMAMKRSATTQ
ncbi:MAG: RNA-protein complex protein Nop10 [Chloroflexi bacterium]|nr:RNA-protein complex protein Nop10 [Chloroflexota bacterium]